MTNSLFTSELPLIETNEELAIIKRQYPKYDSYFIASGCYIERREKFNKLWIKYKPFADRHFLNQIKTSFHQRTWEMYLGNVFLGKELMLESRDEGPDFIIKNVAYVECVAPTKGDPSKPNSVPDLFVATTPEEIQVQDVPVDKMVLRITGVIKDKALNQYENWKGKKWFSPKMPFIIAINTADLSHAENPNLPNVIKALFGFHFQQINTTTGESNFLHRDKIEKISSEPVPVNYFVNGDFSFVSGIIFSNKLVLNHPENIGEDCIFVNNPFADNPITKSFTNLFKCWHASRKDTGIYLEKGY